MDEKWNVEEICELAAMALESAMSELGALGFVEGVRPFEDSRPESVAEFGACWGLDAEAAERRFPVYRWN